MALSLSVEPVSFSHGTNPIENPPERTIDGGS